MSNFILEDIRQIKLREKFDAVVCINDTINHLLKLREVDSLFSKVSKHLESNGIFIFDFNTHELLIKSKSEKESDWVFTVSKDKRKFLIYRRFKKGKYVVWNFLFLFKTKNSLFKMKEERIIERMYELEQMKKLLKKNGFKPLETLKIGKHKLLIIAMK